LLREVMGISVTHALDNKSKLGILDILDVLPFYVLLVDENHCILEANSAVYTQLGVKRGDILGKYCPTVIHGLQQPFPGCPLEEAAQKNQSVERELFDQQSGRWVISAVYPIRAVTRDNKRAFLHMVTDITERKQAQEQLRISHEQLRSLSAHLESVREEEKREIARDLHDETSQLLTSLYAHLEAAIDTLPEDAKKTGALLRKAQNLSTTILDEIHELIYELRPAMLDDLGLTAAISSLVDSRLKMAGVKVSMKTTGKVRRLSPSLEIALFRVVQEAFNNIAKHAHANKAIVSVHFKKDSIKIYIKDNGTGFDVQEFISSKNRSRGLGLLSMRERVELVNGSLVIKSSPGQGAEITIDVPLTGGVDGR
jgi:PAS domain S-box-containing protein